MSKLTYQLAAAGVMLLGAYALGNFHGRAVVQAKWDRQTTQQIAADHKVLLNGINDSFNAGVAHEEQREKIRVITNTIVKEIPVYLRDDAACQRMPDGYSGMYNRVAQAANARLSAGKFDDPATALAPDAGTADAETGTGG